MAKYRRKPFEVSAWRVGSLDEPFPDWLREERTFGPGDQYVEVHAMGTRMRANRGDWVVRDNETGGLCVCRHDFFMSAYEPAD